MSSAVNTVSHWASIDLDESKFFDEIVIEWQIKNVDSYKIEISGDNSEWTSIYSSSTKKAMF